MAFSTIVVDVDDRGCGHVVLNRPRRLNAFNNRMLQELAACVAQLNANPAVKVVAVSGAEGNFSSGRDLAELAEVADRDSARPLPAAGGHESSMLRDLEMPVVALIDGVVVGGGLGFALQCDIRVATSRARLLDGHLSNGMVPSVAAWYLPRLMTIGQALRFVAASVPIGAAEARALGLVDAVVEPGELDQEFDRVAAPFLAADARLVRHAKSLLRTAEAESYDRAMSHSGLLRVIERNAR